MTFYFCNTPLPCPPYPPSSPIHGLTNAQHPQPSATAIRIPSTPRPSPFSPQPRRSFTIARIGFSGKASLLLLYGCFTPPCIPPYLPTPLLMGPGCPYYFGKGDTPRLKKSQQSATVALCPWLLHASLPTPLPPHTSPDTFWMALFSFFR